MSNKKIIAFNILITLIVLYSWWMFTNWGTWQEQSKVGIQFVSLMGFTVLGGIIFVLVVLPRIGESIGAFFYSAPAMIEPDAFTKAAAKVTQGDYEGAVEAYREIADDEPDNRFPIIEIAKIQQDYLGNVDAAIMTLETAVESKEWPINDATFLIFRIQALYLNEKNDENRAKELLQLVINRFPDTRHSANAHHKLNEINQIG
ncbi:MAG: tetratricopeptide repeat protein [Verrucomicrobiales bacterium]